MYQNNVRVANVDRPSPLSIDDVLVMTAFKAIIHIELFL